MALHDWGALTPEQVGQWINFDRHDRNWQYSVDNASMQNRQAEGVAGIWNILATHDVALLADEVGMGKTIQALGVMSLLWKANPDARVLVMAPNRDICSHWVREYHAYLRDHYREVDHLVRNAADGGAVHEPHLCWRLNDLVHAVATGMGQFFLTTIYSLSGLVPQEEKSKGDLRENAARAAGRIHHELKKCLGDDGFDLIIVDEAHYFRNAQGDSQRAHAANKFFGTGESRLGQKAMLMTATPSHSSLNDIPAILGFFTDIDPDGESATPANLLHKHALRRLRLMQGATNYHNKYNYRHEYALPSGFEDNPQAEMFFALYQKKLVQLKDQKGNGRRYLYGYLEGFESVGSLDQDNDVEPPELNTGKAEDFSRSEDTEILARLTKLHFDHFARYPEHPKYNTLVQKCVPSNVFDHSLDLHELKHLIFVRRIPSVREITQRINAEYDRLLARRIIQAWAPSDEAKTLKHWEKAGWSRAFFNNFVQQQGTVSDEDEPVSDWLEDGESVDQESDQKLASRVADIFVVKKVGSHRSTDGSNVSLRFRKPESLFSIFLEPSADYRNGKYLYYYRKQVGDKIRDDYGAAALDCRLALHDAYTQKSEQDVLDSNTQHAFNSPVITAWGMMFDLLTDQQRGIIEGWLKRDTGIVENFGNYIKAGFLFASPVMVELYCWFTEFNRTVTGSDVQQRYDAFVRWIAPRLATSMMYQYFVAALENFEAMCDKISDHNLSDWQQDWRVLTSLQNPAWYASGESGNRQRLIVGFNSPFYPNVLVATSVFQEGVNLHLQCRKVHHYGIAWTPGDNEQRVGRVDRLFGRVNQQLRQHGHAELAIHYPYLTRSFDQEQLASFVKLKHGVEARMDACQHTDFKDEIELQQSAVAWEQYLRKPDGKISLIDPFPARFGPSDLPKSVYQAVPHANELELKQHLRNLLASAINRDSDTQLAVADNELHPGIISLIESDVLRGDAIRKQPMVAELRFLSEFSSLVSGTVYTLTLRSPLASLSALGDFDQVSLEKLLEDADELKAAPLVRLALDSNREKSHFYLHLRVDLPLFIHAEALQTLSTYEIQSAVQQLKYAADNLEWRLFNGSQDLRKEDLQVHKYSQGVCDNTLSVNRSALVKKSTGALVESSITGPVAVLARKVKSEDVRSFAEARFGDRQNRSFFVTLLKLNHLLPMTQFRPKGKGIELRIAYPADDFQIEEQSLISRWFSCVLDQLLHQ